MANFAWTEDQVATLKKLWQEGLSASIIAMRLRPLSRSAVIGKVHRLGLSGRVRRQTHVTLYSTRKHRPKKRSAAVQRFERLKEIKATLPPLPETDTPKGPLISFADLQEHHCRASYGDPRQEGFGFCGCSVVPTTPYCAEHLRRFYQMGTAPKRAQRPTMLARLSRRLASPVGVTDREDVLA